MLKYQVLQNIGSDSTSIENSIEDFKIVNGNYYILDKNRHR